MGRSKPEQYFEYRIKRLLEGLGYVVVNCASSRPVDLVAMRCGEAFLIEVKGRSTRLSAEQWSRECELAAQAGFPLVVIRQSVTRGKFTVEGSELLQQELLQVKNE